jgi:ubiquinone/menaquinone biosynthesis C-methylase UbiE
MTEGSQVRSFEGVDRQGNPKDFIHFLDVVSSLPAILDYKEKAYSLLNPQPGQIILDVGCGLGEDMKQIADRTNNSARVFGIDNSANMIQIAKKKAAKHLLYSGVLNFSQQDASEMSFVSETFDSVYSDRVFQHLTSPERAAKEVIRVLKPGGRFIIADPYWESLRLEGVPMEASLILRKCYVAIIKNPKIAKSLESLMIAEGVKEDSISERKITLAFDGPEQTNAILWLEASLEAGVKTGKVSAEEMARTMETIRHADPKELKTYFDLYMIEGKKS